MVCTVLSETVPGKSAENVPGSAAVVSYANAALNREVSAVRVELESGGHTEGTARGAMVVVIMSFLSIHNQ